MNKERLWTKEFIVITIINFFLLLSMYLLLVTIVPFVTGEFNVSTSMAGFVAGIFVIGCLFGRLATGRYMERIGFNKTLLFGLIFFFLTTALYFAAFNIYVLLIIRFLHGISVGIATSAAGSIVALQIPSSRSGEGISYFSMSNVLSTAIGPLVGILLSQYADYNMIFLFSLVLGSIALVISFSIQEHVVETEELPKVANKKKILSSFLEYKVIPISLVMFIGSFTYSSVLSFLTVYADEINLIEVASFFFLVFAMAISISRPFTGRLLDAKGANIIIYPCLIIFAIGMLVLSQANNGIILLLAAIFIGIGYGNLQSITQALAIKVVPKNRVGLATSTYFIFLDLGFGLGPLIHGTLIKTIGYRGLYLSLVFVIIFLFILYFFLHGRKERKYSRKEDESIVSEN